MGEPLLDIRGLSKTFAGGRRLLGTRRPPTVALDDVSLAVAPARTLGVVGESGCGKTTLARVMAGLTTPTRCERLRLRGAELRGQPRALRGAVQLVFQDPASALNPRRRVRHALETPMRARLGLPAHERARRIEALAQQVSLDPALLDRYPHELSGGQAQRVGIARALAAEPVLVVLDEPTSALDVSVQAQILKLLGRLQGKLGLTFVFISHDLAVVEHFCHSVAVMYFGRVVEYGPRERIFRAPRHAYTRTLLASVPAFGRGG